MPSPLSLIESSVTDPPVPLRPTPSPLYCWPSLPLPEIVEPDTVAFVLRATFAFAGDGGGGRRGAAGLGLSPQSGSRIADEPRVRDGDRRARLDLHARAGAVGHAVPVEHDARGVVDPDG